jgi:ubiquitin-protein ligase E3 C
MAAAEDPSRRQILSKYTILASLAPLKNMTRDRLPAYEAFASEFLTISELSKPPLAPKWLDKLSDSVNYKLLANVLATTLMPQIQGQQKQFRNPRSRANLLACLIYFCRKGRLFQQYSSFTDEDYMMVVSTLLNSVATDSGTKKSGADYEDEEQSPFTFAADEGDDAFIQEQINSLADADSIDSFLGPKSSNISGLTGVGEHAEHIASFALTLLRFFPLKGDDIRIRLYMGSGGIDPARPLEKTSAFRYFWKAARATHVFNDIARDADSVIPLLKPTSPSEGTGLQDSWRVILIFMELYTFVLKLMDDEEFFSHSDALHRTSTRASQNALPLDEVKALTLFLKNLGFVLYFDAASISNSYGRPRDGSISSYFNPSQSHVPEPEPRSSEISIAGLPGIGVDYVKGLVTGLLRMLYERDSRRPFLPKDHWLMTSRFDMQSFIPSVVEEEEKRHRIQENDDEDDDEPGNAPVGSGHAARTVHMQRLQRQQRHFSRLRQMQAVAPRLEILQNMPFFIPFETRVQIFREFVALDKVKTSQRAWAVLTGQANRVRDASNPTLRLDPMTRMVDFLAGASDMDPRRAHHARIRRDHVIDDAYDQFNSLGDGLKDPIQITFVDNFGQDEAGIDGGGVTKEFLTSITKEMFTPSKGIQMFAENEQHLQFPNPAAMDEYREILLNQGLREGTEEYRRRVTAFLSRYEFLGRIIGKCLYEGILVDVAFAGFFLLKWALTGGNGSAPRESGYRANINDLRELDEGLYQGLVSCSCAFRTR